MLLEIFNSFFPSLLYATPCPSFKTSVNSFSVALDNRAISLSAQVCADGVLFSVSLFVAIFVAVCTIDWTKIGN